MNNTYKLTHTVGYSEVDSYYKLRLDYIFSHFQNIAGLHSIEMGTDGESILEKSNALWVMTKMKLRIAELPRFGETITVETWPLKAKGVRFDRDFVLNSKEKPLLMGSSEWCTLDFTTHKLRKVESVDYPHNMPFREDRSGAGEWVRVKESVCDTDLHHIHRSAFVDVDSNKHTNNVAYLRMVLNCFTPDEFEALRIDELQINFLSQTFYGDEIKIYKKKLNNGFFVEGKKEGKSVFACAILLH